MTSGDSCANAFFAITVTPWLAGLLALVHLGFDDPLVTVRADPMTEAGFRMFGDIGLDLAPVVPVVADLLAVGADGEQSLELFDPGEGILQFGHALGQV